MSAADNKKSKRRKNKKGAVSKAATQNTSNGCGSPTPENATSLVDSETIKKLEKLMDARDESEMPVLSFSRGPNPFLDRERCLLCNCERQDPPEAARLRAESASIRPSTDTNPLSQAPLWVCPTCRKSADQETERKPMMEPFMDSDLGDPSTFLPEFSIKSGSEPTTPNGTLCSCDACTERRMIESDHEKETAELQRCWTDLRKVVRFLYGQRDFDCTEDLSTQSLPDDNLVQDMVHRLCTRDPHQLFLRLESQVREFVIEMKVRLLKQLSTGFKSPPLARQFIALLLEEYAHLCRVARRMAGLLKDLQEHLKRFKVTWDLHNKHLFQSIAYSEPAIRSSLAPLVSQLRLGAASKESYTEDTYPSLLHRYLKFDDEMSVISVVWRDCHQLIEHYNEEQSALKLKQKMLREDWEFFKTQRKILEQQVSQNPQTSLSHSFEAQFTETMRLMLQGSKPTQEELLCPRCNRKRCPCDECTITHMITCGIISPEVLESAGNGTETAHHPNFLHDPNRYRIDVSPPSMSSTTSSSGSSSPIMVDSDRLALPFQDNSQETGDDIQEEIEDMQSYDEDDEDDEDEEEDEENGDNKMEHDKLSGADLMSVYDVPSLEGVIEINLPSLTEDDDVSGGSETGKLESCNCDHCVSQAKLDQLMKTEDNQCQCHVCLQQQGKTVLTSLPQHVPQVVPRPGELHLYPHIHGSGLLGMGRGHVRPLLQPNLYDLHLPHHQQRQKPIIQPKVPMKLDFDSPEGIQDHMYHAYGDWDNTYDARLLLGSPKFDSELLPPPPLSSAYASSFLSEPFSVGNHLSSSAISASLNQATSAVSSSGSQSVSSLSSSEGDTAPLVKEPASRDGDNRSNRATNSRPTSPSKNQTPLCKRPATLGGNSTAKFPDKCHNQHCKKHSLQGIAKAGNHSHMMQTKEGRQRVQELANKMKPNVGSSPCNNENSRSKHLLPGGGVLDPHAGLGLCAKSISLPTTVSNVSVGTSTPCTEPDCDGDHDDNYDSIDDSCSEQSSSTSTSNQKDGKYCDCCYCEFFGHGSPPMAPTSKNYAEMRDKLRLRLKKKLRQHSEPHGQNIHPHPKLMGSSEDPLGTKGLDELIRFINGNEAGKNEEKQLSAKAAKRARQKQRKAEERERLRIQEERAEAERIRAQNRKQRKEASKSSPHQSSPASSLEPTADSTNGRQTKKRTKHKERDQEDSESDSEIRSSHTQSGKISHQSPVSEIKDCQLNRHSGVGKDAANGDIAKARPNPQGSSTSSVIPFHEDNRDVLFSKANKNKMPGKCAHLMNDAQHLHDQQLLQQQANDRQQQLIRLKFQERAKRHNQLQQLKQLQQHQQQQQQQVVNEKGKKVSLANAQNHTARVVTAAADGGEKWDPVRPDAQPAPSQRLTGGSQVNSNLKSSQDPRQGHNTSSQPTLPGKKQRKLYSMPDGLMTVSETSSPSQSVQLAPILQNGIGTPARLQGQVRRAPQGQAKTTDVPADKKQGDGDKAKQDSSLPDQKKNSATKNKRNKKKNRKSSDVNFIDEVFMPKSESDLEGGELDENEREIEAFKRFCYDSSAPVQRERLQVNVNIKDIFSKKKTGLSCN